MCSGQTRILDLSHYVKVRVFTDATLRCVATTDIAEMTRLSVQWHDSSDRLMTNSSDGRITMTNWHNQTSLHFTPAYMEDSGKYSCVASNGLDTVARPSYLFVQGRLDFGDRQALIFAGCCWLLLDCLNGPAGS